MQILTFAVFGMIFWGLICVFAGYGIAAEIQPNQSRFSVIMAALCAFVAVCLLAAASYSAGWAVGKGSQEKPGADRGAPARPALNHCADEICFPH